MGYNPFRWYTKGKKKRLPHNAHLFDKIQNGDYDYSQYYAEAEEARKEYSSIFQSIMSKYKGGEGYFGYENEARHAARMKNVKALKLDEEGHKDEQKILLKLKEDLFNKFGFCLWDKMMDEKPMGLEELYDYYCQEKMRRKGLDV